MGKLETSFLERHSFQPVVWFRYIKYLFLIWANGEENLNNFVKSLNEQKYRIFCYKISFKKRQSYN